MDFMKYIKRTARVVFWAVSKNTALDKYVAKDFDGTYAQYYMYSKPLFVKDNYYWNVYNDYIIEVWLDKTMSTEMDAIYSETKAVTPSALEAIKEATSKPGKSRMVISRNAKRADKLKKLLGKHFFIPKQQRA